MVIVLIDLHGRLFAIQTDNSLCQFVEADNAYHLLKTLLKHLIL